MKQNPMKKPYDLELRTFQFARDVRVFVKNLDKTISNREDSRQVIRSSGSVGSNYIEANEAFSKKDFNYRIKICRKEAKESSYWIRLINDTNRHIDREITKGLIQESIELKKIFSTIIEKSK